MQTKYGFQFNRQGFGTATASQLADYFCGVIETIYEVNAEGHCIGFVEGWEFSPQERAAFYDPS